MRHYLPLTLLAVSLAAAAAPATYKKAGPNAEGISTFWVKCDNGNVAVAQCLKDEAHCGVGAGNSLPREAVLVCEGIVGLISVPSK